MKNKESLRQPKLSDDKVIVAKRNFDRQKGRRSTAISFDRFFELFRKLVPFAEIATEADITKQAVSAIYNNYFKDLFGAEYLKRRKEKAEEIRQRNGAKRLLAQKSLADKKIALLVKKMQSLGCPISVQPPKNGRTFITVHGRACAVYVCTREIKPKQGVNCLYSSAKINRNALLCSDAVIICICVLGHEEAYFVIPSKVLLALACRSITAFYPPLKKIDAYNNSHSKVPWWDYYNAWHLLQTEDQGRSVSEMRH